MAMSNPLILSTAIITSFRWPWCQQIGQKQKHCTENFNHTLQITRQLLAAQASGGCHQNLERLVILSNTAGDLFPTLARK